MHLKTLNAIAPSAAPGRSRVAIVLVVTVVFSGAPASAAQDKPSRKDSHGGSARDVHPLVLKSLASYLSAKTFYEKSLIRLPPSSHRLAGKKTVGVQFWFERPNKFKVQTSEFEFVSDGKTVQLYSKKLHQYVRTAPPKAFDDDWFRSGPFRPIRLLLPPSFYLLAMAADPAHLPADAKHTAFLSEVRRREDKDRKIRKRSCVAFYIPRLEGYPVVGELLVYIETKHHLIWNAKGHDGPSGKWVTVLQVRKVQRDGVIKPSTFKVKRPSRAVEVERFRARRPPVSRG